MLVARLSNRATVLRELDRRLHCQPESELSTALGEVKKISHLRLTDLLGAHSAMVEPQRGWGSERQQDAWGGDTLHPRLAGAWKDNPYTHTKEVEN